MTKREFHSFDVDKAENGYVIRVFYDDETPPTVYVAFDAVAMLDRLSELAGVEKSKPSATVVKMEPRE